MVHQVIDLEGKRCGIGGETVALANQGGVADGTKGDLASRRLKSLRQDEAGPSALSSSDSVLKQSIPYTEAPAHRARRCSKSPSRSSKWARHSRQAKDISELKSQMAQVLEYLVRQQTVPSATTPAPPLAPALGPTTPSPVVALDVSEQDVAMSKKE
ncbi:UNVERIFIED_CONTAM: hypothetical protein FKN15_019926 [Acipenser sinensis]